jgi:hypothetical protein
MGLGGGSYVDTNDGTLAHAVLRNKLAQKLVPAALAKAYVAVDMIAGRCRRVACVYALSVANAQ